MQRAGQCCRLSTELLGPYVQQWAQLNTATLCVELSWSRVCAIGSEALGGSSYTGVLEAEDQC